MGEYKLSASLAGHEDDVRGVVFPHSRLLCSASRDATVRLWKLLAPSPPKYDCSISSHGSSFVNAIAYVPPSEEYPDGLIVSGGKDTIIEVRQPGKPAEDNAEGLLLGHAHNVCALDVSPDGKRIVSGSWDGTARVWQLGKWDSSTVLEGHEGSVWAVLAYDNDTIITACADKLIRIFTPTGKLLLTIKGNTDVVRALCKIPAGHASKADFASASNDGTIRLWQLGGRPAGQLLGHESFIYSLATLPNGDLVSSGEDRTLRIWRGSGCIQTITHPAISVWAVAVCPETGDIASGASDRILRVFTRSPDRHADPEATRAFDDAVKSSSIPQQQVGDVNKEKLPGPAFLAQRSGTKEGQVVMIKQADGSVTAHQWSHGGQEWRDVGTVVDAVGSSGRKKDYRGQDYDYVFDVDIEDGQPPLQLPYNLAQNPYEAARTFIEANELPVTYLDQVADFITTNTQGATLGPASSPPAAAQPRAGADPWGTEARYRPGDATPTTPAAPPAPPPPPRPTILPQRAYLSIQSANLPMISKKLLELNAQLAADDADASASSSSSLALSPQSLATLQTLLADLAQTPAAATTTNGPASLAVVLHLATRWPEARRLPGLDVLRLVAATASPAAAAYRDARGRSVIGVLEATGVFGDAERANHVMLAVRVLANLFATAPGRALMSAAFAQVQGILKSISPAARANRNVQVAVATLYVNYAVLSAEEEEEEEGGEEEEGHAARSAERGVGMMGGLVDLLRGAQDSEVVYRGLVAVGTLLGVAEEVRVAAREVWGLEGVLAMVEGRWREERVRGVVAEIRGLVG